MKYSDLFLFLCIICLLNYAISSIGLIGCKFEKNLCLSNENCFEDNPFGSCIDASLKENDTNVIFNYTTSQLALLGTVLNQLASAGFTWSHLYTQCKIHFLLLSFREKVNSGKDHCSMAVKLVSQDKTSNHIEKLFKGSTLKNILTKDVYKSISSTPDALIKEFYISRQDLILLKDFVLNLNKLENKSQLNLETSTTAAVVTSVVINSGSGDAVVNNALTSSYFPQNKSQKRVNLVNNAVMSAQDNKELAEDHLRHKLLMVVYILVVLALLLTCVLVILVLVWRRLRMLDWDKFKLDDADSQSLEYQELCRDEARLSHQTEAIPISSSAIYSDILQAKNMANCIDNC